MNSHEPLFEEYLKSRADLKSSLSFKKPVVISFVALNGVGKSYFANKLSQRLGGMPISCNDFVRRFLESKGLSGEGDKESPRHFIATRESEYFYQNNISHIVDADLIKWYQDTKKAAESHGFKLLMIHLVCPEKVTLERIEKRWKEVLVNPESNYSRVNTDEYYNRKKLHQQLGLPTDFYMTIDSSLDLDIQLDKLVEKMKSDEYLK